MSDVFISYSRQDIERVRWIEHLITSRGYSSFIDLGLQAGEDYNHQLARVLDEAKVVIVVWSNNSAVSSHLRYEVQYALKRSRVLPILIDPVPVSEELERYNHLMLWDWDGSPDHPGAIRLIEAIESILGGAYESVVTRGRSNVRDLFSDTRSRAAEELREAKVLFVGHGGAGKTSLTHRLFSSYGRRPLGRFFERRFGENESPTLGIQIGRLNCALPDGEMSLNLWDFGGQEIMHSMHEFFFSRRSLYVLVLDGRREENPDYWLNMATTYGGQSKIIVVMNKIDQNPAFELDRRKLMEAYPNIVCFHRISCKTGEGVDALGEEIVAWGRRIEHLQTVWPTTWLRVKAEVEKIHKDFISFDHFEGICRNYDLYDDQEIEGLADYLNDLGVIFHLEGPVLGQTAILNPSWVTEGVYRILTSPTVRKANGVFRQDDLPKLLDAQRFPKSRHTYLIELMRRFELCYQQSDGVWLTPDLLPVEQPELSINPSAGLRYKLSYGFLPKSVFPRIIINLNLDLQPGMAWRSGCVVSDPTADARSLIRVNATENSIDVNVVGNDRSDYFSIIRRTLIHVSSNPTPLNYQELVPCTCEACSVSRRPHYYRFDVLKLRRGKGKTTIDCERSIETVKLDDLLGGLDASQSAPAWDVFISYSTKDQPTVGKIIGDIRERGLAVWYDDEEIKFGDSISQSIETGLRRSRFVIPCISRNQLESGWSRAEYTAVFNRNVRGTSATRLAPIIIDDIDDDQIPTIFSDIRCARYSNPKAYANLLAYISGQS